MKLPQSWNDITVAQYRELREANASEFSGLVGMMAEVLAILTETEPGDILSAYRPRKIREFYAKVEFIHRPPNPKLRHEIGEYRYKGTTGLTLGEYIDLLSWNESSKGEYFAALLYRKTRQGSWGETEMEPRVYDLEERAREFDDMTISQVWGCVNDFRAFNERLREAFKDIFPMPDADEEEPEEESKAERRTISSMRDQAREEARKRHQWQKLVHDLCDGDITKRTEVLKTPVIYVFNVLGMQHDLKDK